MVLYHASQKKNLKLIKPQRTISNDQYIGDYVFATRNKFLALMYLTPKGIPILMDAESNEPNIVICATPAQFNNLDVGGAVYELSNENFTETPQRALNDHEMVSKTPVKPLRKEVFHNTLDTFMNNGIVVRFVDEKTFEFLIGNKNQKKLIADMPKYGFN